MAEVLQGLLCSLSAGAPRLSGFCLPHSSRAARPPRLSGLPAPLGASQPPGPPPAGAACPVHSPVRGRCGRPAHCSLRAGALPAPVPAPPGPAAPARRLRGSSAATAERPPRGGSASAAAPATAVPRPPRPARPLPAPSPLPSRRGRGRSDRGSVVLRRRGRAPPRRSPPAPLSAQRRQNKAPGPGPGAGPSPGPGPGAGPGPGPGRGPCPGPGPGPAQPGPARPGVRRCGRAEHRARAAGSSSGSVPGAGTYTVRPALAALTSRRIRPRQDVPQPLRYAGVPLPPSLRYGRPLRYPPRSGALLCGGRPGVSLRRPPGAAAAPVPRSPRGALGGRRRVGAGSARRLLLKPDPAPPSAPRSPHRPHPRPATRARRHSAAPERPRAGVRGDGTAWRGTKERGSSLGEKDGTEGQEGLEPG